MWFYTTYTAYIQYVDHLSHNVNIDLLLFRKNPKGFFQTQLHSLYGDLIRGFAVLELGKPWKTIIMHQPKCFRFPSRNQHNLYKVREAAVWFWNWFLWSFYGLNEWFVEAVGTCGRIKIRRDVWRCVLNLVRHLSWVFSPKMFSFWAESHKQRNRTSPFFCMQFHYSVVDYKNLLHPRNLT